MGPTHEEALRIMIYLHDRYALDGRDPNTYTNILWCFGLHDRPWTERAIFGQTPLYVLRRHEAEDEHGCVYSARSKSGENGEGADTAMNVTLTGASGFHRPAG